MRVTLPSGGSAELRERLTWAERNRVRDAAGGDDGFFQGFATTLVKTYTASWTLDLPLDDDGWTRLDGDDGDAIFRAALRIWKESPDPKAIVAPSSSS